MSIKTDLVIAYRTLADHGVIDAYGHVSVRSPTDPNRYYLSRALAPEIVTEDDIIEYDLDSHPIDDQGRVSVFERYIHGEIFKARPEINSVVHSHSATVVPFSITGVPLKPIFHMAAFIGLGVSNFEIRDAEEGTDLLIKSPYLGQALAKCLGQCPATLMRGHGAASVGESLQRAVGRAIYLEMSARMQLDAVQLAGPTASFKTLDDSEVNASVHKQEYGRAWILWRDKALAKLEHERQSKNATKENA
jgi:HCOMODA/2-hydroxy-3-carboxy-muconic semialdehyde decarboxylase